MPSVLVWPLWPEEALLCIFIEAGMSNVSDPYFSNVCIMIQTNTLKKQKQWKQNKTKKKNIKMTRK